MKWIVVAIVSLALLVFFWRRPSSHRASADDDCVGCVAETAATPPPATPSTSSPSARAATERPVTANKASTDAAVDAAPGARAAEEPATAATDAPTAIRDYTVEDGVAVIEGDIVIGLPGSAGREAQVPPVTPWPTSEIPYFIQPSVPQPERILEALSFFANTPVRFVPVTNQQDTLVFENAAGKCKSYMGRVGGKQPIYIAANCGPHEIAHELMHALGFIHEQNRTDRDAVVQINRDNILGTAIVNFEKFPADFMPLSGLSPFDLTSIMMYPPSMFSQNGQPTMTALKGTIAPSERLSAADVERITKYYGSR